MNLHPTQFLRAVTGRDSQYPTELWTIAAFDDPARQAVWLSRMDAARLWFEKAHRRQTAGIRLWLLMIACIITHLIATLTYHINLTTTTGITWTVIVAAIGISAGSSLGTANKYRARGYDHLRSAADIALR